MMLYEPLVASGMKSQAGGQLRIMDGLAAGIIVQYRALGTDDSFHPSRRTVPQREDPVVSGEDNAIARPVATRRSVHSSPVSEPDQSTRTEEYHV